MTAKPPPLAPPALRHDTDTIANFPRRLARVIEAAAPPGADVEVFPYDPGGVWKLAVRVVSPTFSEQSAADRERPFWQAVLDHLWDEQERVGSILAKTPEDADAGFIEPAGSPT